MGDKAVELDPADARERMVAASAYFFTKQLDSFAREADQALALAPYDAEIMAVLACMISSQGDHKRGVALAEKANALNPDAATGWYHSTREHTLKVARQNQDAEMFYFYLEIIPIFGQLGLQHEALGAWKKLQAQLPDATAKTFEDWWRLWNMPEADIAKLMDGVYLLVDDKDGKPVGINEFIGRRPIACFGNSDGDKAMLEYTTINNPRPSFGLIVHHTNAEREYAYDDHPKSSGKLVEALQDAPQRGWIVVRGNVS